MCFVTVDVFQRPIGALFIATATVLSLACWLCYATTHHPLCQLPTHCPCRCRGEQMCLAWLSGLSDCCSSEKLRSARFKIAGLMTRCFIRPHSMKCQQRQKKRHRQKRSAIALPSPLSNVSSKNSIIISSNNRRSVSHCKLSIIDAENHLLILPPAAPDKGVPDTLSVDKLFRRQQQQNHNHHSL